MFHGHSRADVKRNVRQENRFHAQGSDRILQPAPLLSQARLLYHRDKQGLLLNGQTLCYVDWQGLQIEHYDT